MSLGELIEHQELFKGYYCRSIWHSLSFMLQKHELYQMTGFIEEKSGTGLEYLVPEVVGSNPNKQCHYCYQKCLSDSIHR